MTEKAKSKAKKRDDKKLTWVIDEIEDGWVAKSGTGVFVYADERDKLVGWILGNT